MEIILVKEKETPGTWRFKEDKEDHPLTIYLTKEQVKELGSLESIKVTIAIGIISDACRLKINECYRLVQFNVLQHWYSPQ